MGSELSGAARERYRVGRGGLGKRRAELGHSQLHGLTDNEVLDGNAMDVFVGGEAAYGAMLGSIASARTSIALQTYILDDDETGHRFRDALLERVRAGVPYLGVSAGTNVACPTVRTTNDMPIVEPPSLDALGLVPFQVNPHYYTGANYVRHGEALVEHFGETRDDRLREFHEENATPVVGLWEGGILRVAGGRVMLVGANARVFRRGELPVDVAAGAELSVLV